MGGKSSQMRVTPAQCEWVQIYDIKFSFVLIQHSDMHEAGRLRRMELCDANTLVERIPHQTR